MDKNFSCLYDIFAKLNRYFTNNEKFDLSAGEIAVLYTIEVSESQALHISQICDRTGIARPSITPILRRLEDRGFICRVSDDSDGRRYLVSMTERFHQIKKNNERRREMVFENLVKKLEPDEFKHFSGLLKKFEGIMDNCVKE